MARARHDASVGAFVSRVAGREPRVVQAGAFEILHLDDYPAVGRTTLISVGLATHVRSIYRRMAIGFELVATAVQHTAVLHERLAAAIDDDLEATARGDGYLRIATMPPRGIMYNGVFAAGAAPHLLFATDLTLTPAIFGRHRIGNGYVEFLPAIPITQGELAAYDASPPSLIARLEHHADLDDVSKR